MCRNDYKQNTCVEQLTNKKSKYYVADKKSAGHRTNKIYLKVKMIDQGPKIC